MLQQCKINLAMLGIDVSSEDVAQNIVENSQIAPNAQIICDQPMNDMPDNHSENMEDSLSLPLKQLPESWLVEGVMNLGFDLQVEDELGTFSFPLPPPTAPLEVVHYYANCGHDGDSSQESPPLGIYGD